MIRPQPPEMPLAADAPRVNEFDDMDKPGVDAPDYGDSVTGVDWFKLAEQAHHASQTYMDSNLRTKWEDGLRAFSSRHAQGSKYTNPAYEKRSRVYRPKTRAAIRKNEAAAAAAFFSSMDVVSIDAQLQNDPVERASAEVMKSLLQYRLMSSDPHIALQWFATVMGAIQDAQTIGVVVSRQYWNFEHDRPDVKLIPAENLKISPAADWRDPIGSSPYIIEDIPMYVGEIKDRMAAGEWRFYGEQTILASTYRDDTTRQARLGQREDPARNTREVSDYDTAWVQRHIHRRNGKDYVFYVLPHAGLLTDAEPLESEVFHGERDYVMGCVVIETHKPYPAGLPEISQQTQEEINELTNQGLDNTKFVLNKRWIVKRGKNVDAASLVRNVPGGVTLADDPEGDVKEINWPDITPSVFEQQNRLSADFADLLGDYNAAQAQLLMRGAQQPASTLMHMAQAPAPLVDYLLRTFVETWAEPVLRQIVRLEQMYETDQTVLAVAADKAKVFQRYGIDRVTDDLLNRQLTLNINVVFGAMTPMAKLQRFSAGLMSLSAYSKAPIPGVSLEQIAKETFGLMGYQDGARFMEDSPDVAQIKQSLALKDQAIAELTRRLNDKEADRNLKLVTEQDRNKTAIVTTVLKHEKDDRHKLADVGLTMMAADQQKAAKEDSAA